MAVALKNDAMARDDGALVSRRIVDFVRGFSIETTPGSALKIPDYRAYLRPGTTVAAPESSGENDTGFERWPEYSSHPDEPCVCVRSRPP